MTVETELDRIDYSGDGTTVNFPFPYKFLANSDIYVYLRATDGTETLQIFGTNYALTGLGLEEGGAVVMTLAPASGEKLVIFRDPPATQLTDYIEGDKFPAESHETALDKLTFLIQRLKNLVGRALSLRVTDTTLGGGAYDAGNNRIINMADPVNNQDAVTKNAMQVYVGSVVSGATPIVDPDYGTLASGDQIQRRRGTTAQHAAFTGALGEITIDTDKKTAVVHDGSTAGGSPLASTKGFTMSGMAQLAEGGAIASASALALGTDGNVFHVTGTTQINSINAISGAGPVWLIFDGALTFKHNASIIQIGAVDVTTAAGDMAMLMHEGAGVWRVLMYSRASGGSGSSAFPTGTRMLFQQTAAPTGWTKETNSAFNDQALRLVTGSVSNGGATGFSSVFGAGKATNSHTLTTSEIPAHQHGSLRGLFYNSGGGFSNIGVGGTVVGADTFTANAGGGAGHSHGLSLNLSYRDVIIAQAN